MAWSPLATKSSASIGRNSGSSTPLLLICWKRASALSGLSWKLFVSMWQSEHARPLPPNPASTRSWNKASPRMTGSPASVECSLGDEEHPKSTANNVRRVAAEQNRSLVMFFILKPFLNSPGCYSRVVENR